MSSEATAVQAQAQLDIKARAEAIRKKRLEAAGLSQQFDLWRESMPNLRMPDNEVYDLFMDSQVGEEAAATGKLSVMSYGEVQKVEEPEPPSREAPGAKKKMETGKEEERDTEIQPVEGMWTPPKEAATENYIEPSTYEMTRSKDFLENAKIVYEYMNPAADRAEERRISSYGQSFIPPDMLDAKEERAAEGLNAEELGDWSRNLMSGFNWNVVNTMAMAQRIMTSEDPKLALAFLNMINMYDHSDGGAMDFAGAIQEIATDPTTYVGLGVGAVAAKGAAIATAKTGLKKSIQMAIVGSTGGAIEGGMLAGGFDLTVQNVEQEAGARKDIDYGRAAVATGLGVGLGTLLGGAGGAWAGRKMDKFAKLMAEDKRLMEARDVFLDEQALKEMGAKELYDLLSSLRVNDVLGTGGKAAKVAEGAEDPLDKMVSGILNPDGSMPRLDDGSVDYKKIYRVIDQVQNQSVALQAAKAAKLIDTEERLANYMDKVSEADNNWFYDESSGDLTYFNEEGHYVRLERLAEHMGIDHNVGGRGGVEVFSLDGGTPQQKADFIMEITDILPNPPPKAVHGGAAGRGVDNQHQLSQYMEEVSEADNNWTYADDTGDLTFYAEDGNYEMLEALAKDAGLDHNVGGRGGVEIFSLDGGTPQQKADLVGTYLQRTGGEGPFRPDIMDVESQNLINKILELDELESGDVVIRTPSRPGSRVKSGGEEFEIVGRTKNGWYRMRDKLGQESNRRRKDFEVIDKAPAPRKAGPMELDPFSASSAKLIAMNEEVLSGDLKLRAVKTTHKEQEALAAGLEKAGIDITQKPIESYWTPSELLFLRDTYERQAQGIGKMARILESQLRNEGVLTDSQLADFNNAHSIFVATRDLFYGTSGNAARQLNILRSKPKGGEYDFTQGLMDSISLQGGRANTERAIKLMATHSRTNPADGGKGPNINQRVTALSENIWGSPFASRLLNVRYNMMLSSWRTHFFNFLGNSASGVYQHLGVSPVRMGINNINHAAQVALGVIDPRFTPDPADRMTRHMWYAELRGHLAGARDSLALAKEIAFGRDIGEGKVWNELGLRYNVINVPDTWYGVAGTTPVRLLEAGDAFFKNQYYTSKMHELASIRARYEEVHEGADYQKQYQHYINDPGALGGAAEREALAFAQKQTYTNDPNVYGGVLAAVAKGVSEMQNRSVAVNMIIPFVRTPANLLSYSMEMIGANTFLSPAKTYQSLMRGTQREQQEALAKLTIAAGLWILVQEAHENGHITGTGPSNWEERQVWEAAGWQANSIKVWGHWINMERAAPGGMALATIASVFDYYAMTQQQNKPAMEWIGAGLLYTADMVMDESYLSTATDILTAISSKETGRIESVGASMINSVVVPNILRDLRRPADATKRSTAGTDMLEIMVNQMQNATPSYLDAGQVGGSSEDLPPTRDWKGDPVNYWGNAYLRAIIPFNVRNSADNDPASMALAYNRIPVATPNKTISWPGGMGDAIDLFAMDEGQGYVYDEYKKIIGNNRQLAVETLMDTQYWEYLVEDGDIGPGSTGDMALRLAVGLGSQYGRLEMLDFLISHHGENNTYRRIGPKGKELDYLIHHPVSVETYIDLQDKIRNEGYELTQEEQQYIIDAPVEGPEFFKP